MAKRQVRMRDRLRVEVVFALPELQVLTTVALAADSTVRDAIEASGLKRCFPDYDLDALAVGVWGDPVQREAVVRDGDRVELYRVLQMDPREARRRLAKAGKTMAEPRPRTGSRDPG